MVSVRLAFLAVLSGLLIGGRAIAEGKDVGGAGAHGAPPHSEHAVDRVSSNPLLPEGKTLDEVLDHSAKPPPGSFGKPLEDDAVFTFSQFELLEYRLADRGQDELAWDAQGWIGTDDHKFWWKSEGEAAFEGSDEGAGNLQALYARPVSPFWFFQIGVEAERTWEAGNDHERISAVLGFQGIAPYLFDMEPTLFLTDHGELLGQLTASYYLYLTQRWALQPRLELGASSEEVPDLGFGTGMNYGDIALRLLYEVRREIAPYVGVRYQRLFAETGNIAEREGREAGDVQLVAGVRAAL